MRHRHRWVRAKPDGLLQKVACKLKGCDFAYHQALLFDPSEYEA